MKEVHRFAHEAVSFYVADRTGTVRQEWKRLVKDAYHRLA